MKNLSIAALLALYASVTLAAPVPDATDTVELESRQLGFLLRGAGKVFKKLPEKAGKKMAKNGRGQDNVVEGKRLKETTARWTKFLGKEQDPKCVQGWMNNISANGGFNAVINCDKNPTPLFGHTGGFYPSANEMAGKSARKSKGKTASKPKSKTASKPKGKGGKKRREFLEDDLEAREFFDNGLEGRDLVPVHILDLLEREFGSDFGPDERDLLNLYSEERDFITDYDLDDIE